MSATTVDPIVVEIIRNAFNSIAGQMSYSLKRAAYSPVIYDMMDFGVGIFDAKAQLLGQGPGLPLFLGGLDHAIEAVRLEYSTPKPGDVISCKRLLLGWLPSQRCDCSVTNIFRLHINRVDRRQSTLERYRWKRRWFYCRQHRNIPRGS